MEPPAQEVPAAPAGPGAGPSSFEADPRVHFNTVSGKWTFEADNGSELEWEVGRGVWVPVLDTSILAAQQAAYSVAGVDESTPVAAELARLAKKRKTEDGESSGPKKAKRPAKAASAPRNTAIYVSHLPPTATTAQLASVFGKAGLILEDAEGEPRIKMYEDENGKFKGEALVVYLKAESVDLAVTLMDETELVLGSGDGLMTVKKATWEKKAEGAAEKAKEGAEAGSSAGPSGKKGGDAQKQKMARRSEKLLAKLTDWDSDEESTADIAARAKNARIVVLQGMFSLKELEEDATLLLDLKEDVRDECETLGEVTNVTLYDREPDGIMTVRFKDDLAAQACIAKMNGRFFSGRSILAFTYDGGKYKKAGQGVSLAGTGLDDDGDAEGAAKEKERLDNYAACYERDSALYSSPYGVDQADQAEARLLHPLEPDFGYFPRVPSAAPTLKTSSMGSDLSKEDFLGKKSTPVESGSMTVVRVVLPAVILPLITGCSWAWATMTMLQTISMPAAVIGEFTTKAALSTYSITLVSSILAILVSWSFGRSASYLISKRVARKACTVDELGSWVYLSTHQIRWSFGKWVFITGIATILLSLQVSGFNSLLTPQPFIVRLAFLGRQEVSYSTSEFDSFYTTATSASIPCFWPDARGISTPSCAFSSGFFEMLLGGRSNVETQLQKRTTYSRVGRLNIEGPTAGVLPFTSISRFPGGTVPSTSNTIDDGTVPKVAVLSSEISKLKVDFYLNTTVEGVSADISCRWSDSSPLESAYGAVQEGDTKMRLVTSTAPSDPFPRYVQHHLLVQNEHNNSQS
ncbi:hypothetical protein RQP46_001486 [Phenoliferia psychrophenolica]